MLELKQWYLARKHGRAICAHGTVQGHYRLMDGQYIHTSSIEKIYGLGKGEYLLETLSGNLYHVQEKEIFQSQEEATREFMAKQQISTMEEAETRKCLEQVHGAFEKKQEAVSQGTAWAHENLKDGELYLIMERDKVVKAYLKYGGIAEEIQAYTHVGMLSDSVLITDWVNGRVDFRYFPEQGDMNPYHWSDGLENIFICNIGKETIHFHGTAETILCPAGEIVRIGHDAYQGEGLFSPDAVNGKNFFQKGQD